MLGWLPQFFYDFLARIVPGSILLIVFWLVLALPWNGVHHGRECTNPLHGIQHLLENAGELESSGWAIFVWILAAYMLSFLLSEAWDATFRKLRRKPEEERKAKFDKMVKDRVGCACGLIGSPHEGHTEDAAGDADNRPLCRHPEHGSDKQPLQVHLEHVPDIKFIRDQLRLVAPSVTRQLLKLRSECRQCEVLMLGLGLLLILDAALLFADGSQLERAIMGVALALSILLLLGKRRRLREFGETCAINSYAMCLSSPNVDLGKDMDAT